ncbi:hypothetical protein MLD38_036337 [Melastoma candidum]|uniref:Uncharacterized protein n=1 Tax=Melastoma candidum TaxID=119954 RepID=A0ACB9LJE6_9MYRT|nr:hypothetical protein MLD38_036337 [Melastoma candidum]
MAPLKTPSLILPPISLLPGSLFMLADDVGSGPCNADLAALLPPPYGNTSHLTCLPVWNSFVLRGQADGGVKHNHWVVRQEV